MLRSAIEKSPDELQLILNEVLELPKRKRRELAELLRETSLSSIISAAKTVAERLTFLAALEAILFEKEKRRSSRSGPSYIVFWQSQKNNIAIGVRTWSQVIEENRARLQFFQEKLEHQVDQGHALSRLQERYSEFLKGVITDADALESSGEIAGVVSVQDKGDENNLGVP